MQVPIIPFIIEQHSENVSYLWQQRDWAIREPHYSLKDLTHLDDRLEANIDGLRIAGDVGWDICMQALALNEPGEVFAAAILAFEGEDDRRVDEVVKVALEEPTNWRALISAMGWLSDEDYQRWIPGLLDHNDISYRRLAITASVIHRKDPGATLVAALDDPEPDFQARALLAVGELKRRDLLPVLRQKYSSQEPSCRFWPAWSAVLLGDRYALDILKTLATAESPFLEQALRIMLRAMDVPSATKWLNDFARNPGVLRYAVLGAGIIGDPLYIPWLISVMTVPEVARVAGEAFTMISGVDLAYDDLDGEWPEGFEAGPTEKPEDEDVAMDLDEDLPWPEPNLIEAWWEKNKNNFLVGKRYLAGKPITVGQCQHVLNTGFQRQRRAAALELALLQKDEPIFNTSAAGFRQQKLLQQCRTKGSD